MARETTQECKERWKKAFLPLVGRKIVALRWMTDKEMEAGDWAAAPIVLMLDDGTLMYPSADDEGNDAGALFLNPSKALKAQGVPEVAPVI